jgi:hypothetical protein
MGRVVLCSYAPPGVLARFVNLVLHHDVEILQHVIGRTAQVREVAQIVRPKLICGFPRRVWQE